MEDNLGIRGHVKKAGEGAATLGKILADVPSLIAQAELAASGFAEMARSGLRLDDETVKAIAVENSRRDFWMRIAVALGAVSLAALAIKELGWL
jgi:ubiquinone biosynthesis protein